MFPLRKIFKKTLDLVPGEVYFKSVHNMNALGIKMPKNSTQHNSWRDLQVLDEIERESRISQRTIADRLGIALGLTNTVLRKLIHKGWITTRALPANRLAYYITPKGFTEKSRLVIEHVKNTVSFFYNVRVVINEKLRKLKDEKKITTVAIFGTGVLAEAVYLSIKELELELAGIYDWSHAPERWMGMKVIEPDGQITADAIVVTDLEGTDNQTGVFAGDNSIMIEMRELLEADLRSLAKMME